MSAVKPKPILRQKHFEITLLRLCHQLIENHTDFSSSAIVGLQPRGVFLARRLHAMLEKILKHKIPYGDLDFTFFRDDFRSHDSPLIPSATDIEFEVENKKIILVDDVLYTGRTVRSAMDALMQLGRPEKIELLVFINRRFSRHLPVEANYVGKDVDTIDSQKVRVEWKETDGEDIVWLLEK
jgi:pyrimidine operon attenuation protein/uracil phosphoribosyltransferase